MTLSHSPQGRLYLIPSTLSPSALTTLSPESIHTIHALRYFIVENARTARRFIRSTDPPYTIDILVIHELDKYETTDAATILAPLFEGKDMGILSEAGCPGIADPGSALVRYAHQHDIQVIPLTGPSSILLALMASGLNGQQFQFHGYLSPKKQQLSNDLKRLEKMSKENGTQIFIETPYRNRQVFETAIEVLGDQTLFGIAADLTSSDEWIRTLEIAAWKEYQVPDLHKRPAVFSLLAP